MFQGFREGEGLPFKTFMHNGLNVYKQQDKIFD